jgi:hypothetical protein
MRLTALSITALTTYAVPPRRLFLEAETDEGIDMKTVWKERR